MEWSEVETWSCQQQKPLNIVFFFFFFFFYLKEKNSDWISLVKIIYRNQGSCTEMSKSDKHKFLMASAILLKQGI